MLGHVWLFATPWTIAHQAPLSMEFLRQEYWSKMAFSSPEDLPDPGIKSDPWVRKIGRQILYQWATWEATKINSSSQMYFANVSILRYWWGNFRKWNLKIHTGHTHIFVYILNIIEINNKIAWLHNLIYMFKRRLFCTF